MINDYTVSVTYKNRDMEPVCRRNYPFTDYCQEQKINLLHIITDVENAFYSLQQERGKDDWPQDIMDDFQHIRHKLLDAANSIERLPRNLCFKGHNIGAVESSTYMAELINKYTANKT